RGSVRRFADRRLGLHGRTNHRRDETHARKRPSHRPRPSALSESPAAQSRRHSHSLQKSFSPGNEYGPAVNDPARKILSGRRKLWQDSRQALQAIRNRSKNRGVARLDFHRGGVALLGGGAPLVVFFFFFLPPPADS